MLREGFSPKLVNILPALESNLKSPKINTLQFFTSPRHLTIHKIKLMALYQKQPERHKPYLWVRIWYIVILNS